MAALVAVVAGAAVLGFVGKMVEVHATNENLAADRRQAITLANLDAAAAARSDAESRADDKIAREQEYVAEAADRVHEEQMAAIENYQGPAYSAPRSDYGPNRSNPGSNTTPVVG